MRWLKIAPENMKNTAIKNFINVGIFATLYILIFWSIGILGYIPALLFVLSFFIAIANSIPLFLFFNKIDRFGMISLFGLVIGFFMFVTGHTWLAPASALFCGLIADIILWSGKIRSFKRQMLANCAISVIPSCMALPMWIMRDSYFAHIAEMCSESYLITLRENTSTYWPLIISISVGILGAILGSLLGKRALKRHFERAGLI
jgi:energy-coupling factor transport system substrate-specific component